MSNSIEMKQTRTKSHVVPDRFGVAYVDLASDIDFYNLSDRYTVPDLYGEIPASAFGSNDIAFVEENGHPELVPCYQVESAATNYVKQSSLIVFDDDPWSGERVSVTSGDSSPDGGGSGFYIKPTAVSGSHVVMQANTTGPSADGTYITSCFVKYDSAKPNNSYFCFEINSYPFSGSGSTGIVQYNVRDGYSAIMQSSNVVRHGMIKISEGFYWCWFSTTRSSDTGVIIVLQILNESKAKIFVGDGSGLIFWNPQFTEGTLPSSVIKTEATVYTRDLDELVLPELSVPAALFSGNYLLEVAFPFNSNLIDGTTWSRCIIGYGESGENSLNYCPDTKKFVIRKGSVTKVESGVVSFDRMKRIILNVNCSAGTLAIEGAKTGNGIFTGTPWTWSSTFITFGHDISDTDYLNGYVSSIFKKLYDPESSTITRTWHNY